MCSWLASEFAYFKTVRSTKIPVTINVQYEVHTQWFISLGFVRIGLSRQYSSVLNYRSKIQAEIIELQTITGWVNQAFASVPKRSKHESTYA